MASSKLEIWNAALSRIGETELLRSETTPKPNKAEAQCRLHYPRVLRKVLEARIWPWATRQRQLAEISSQSKTYAGAGQTVFPIEAAYLDSTQVVVKKTVSGTTTTLTPVTDYTLATDTLAVTVAVQAGESLTIIVATARVGWAYLYPLPSDCVTPIALLGEGQRHALTAVDARIEFELVANDAGNGQLLCCNLPASAFRVLEYVALIDYPPTFSAGFEDALTWLLAADLALSLPQDTRKSDWCMQNYEQGLRQASAHARNAGHTSKPLTPTLAARGGYRR